MNRLTILLVLVLASANASEYLQQYQQDPLSKTFDSEAGGEYPASSKLASDVERWPSSVADPRSYLYAALSDIAVNRNPDLRGKRTTASLSIVNAIDVLRQRLMLELARRKINEEKAQIQKNREFLLKNGKRSPQRQFLDGGDDLFYYGAPEEAFLRKLNPSEEFENKALAAIPSHDDDDPTTGRYNDDLMPYRS